MTVNLNYVRGDPFAEKHFDICIYGAGVAIMTLALHHSEKLSDLLLEGDGFESSTVL